MGRRLQWLAVRGAPIDDLLATLGLEREPDPVAIIGAPAYSLLELASGWMLVLFEGRGAQAGRLDWRAEQLARRGFDAVHFSCDDTTMVNWIGGVVEGRTWRFQYIGADGIDLDGLDVEGNPPSFVEEIIAAQRRAQTTDLDPEPPDHLYDIAPAIGKALIGFDHEEADGVDDVIHALRRVPDR